MGGGCSRRDVVAVEIRKAGLLSTLAVAAATPGLAAASDVSRRSSVCQSAFLCHARHPLWTEKEVRDTGIEIVGKCHDPAHNRCSLSPFLFPVHRGLEAQTSIARLPAESKT